MRAILRTVRRLLISAFEMLWSATYLSAQQKAMAIPSWIDARGGTVLVVAPHPDDEVAGCAGAILRHRAVGDPVVVVVVTDGSASTALGLGTEEMARTRREEVQQAAACLGLDATALEMLGLPEGRWSAADLVGRLVVLLVRHQPRVIYAPSRIDFHPQHHGVATALAAALAIVQGERSVDPGLVVRVYPIHVPLTALISNRVLALGSEVRTIEDSFKCYRTQWGTLERCLRHRRYVGSTHGLGEPAEEYWEMNAAQFEALHAGTPPSGRPYRGLRYDSWSDPLAYWTGRAERRRLREIVASVRGLEAGGRAPGAP